MTPAQNRPYPALNRPKDGYLFVVTYGRSGSTLLQKLLNSIDGYCIRGENNNALYNLTRAVARIEQEPNFQHRMEARGKPKAEMRPFLRPILGTPNDPWYGAEKAEPGPLAKGLFNQFVRHVLVPPQGTRVAGFKDIHYHEDPAFFSTQLDLMRRHFPKARFIFNTRAAAGVANSGWWRKRPAEEVHRIVDRADALFADYAARHPACCHSLHYDAYKDRPAALAPMFEFLGEPFDEAAVAALMEQRLTHLK